MFVCSSSRLRPGLSRGRLADIGGDTRRRRKDIAGDSGHAASNAAGSHSITSMSIHIAERLALLFAMSVPEPIGAVNSLSMCGRYLLRRIAALDGCSRGRHFAMRG
jgi:hypothetical protein